MRHRSLYGAISAALVLTLSSSAIGQQRPAPPTNRNPALTQAQITPSTAARLHIAAAKQRPLALILRATVARLNANRIDLASIDQSHVPILIGTHPQLLANLRIYAFADRYTASAKKPGTAYEINGTRMPVVAPGTFRLPQNNQLRLIRPNALPGAPPPAANEDAISDLRIDHTASGVDLTFTRFGHVYNISIDCGAPAEEERAVEPGTRPRARTANPDCTDAAAQAFAQQMEVIGGGAP